MERQKSIRNEIISSIIYPLIVLVLAFGVVVLLITFVMPRISVLLSQLTKNPPFFTKVLLDVSLFINQHQYLIAGILIIFVFIVLFSLVFKKTRRLIFDIFIKLPLFSKIYIYISLSQVLFILRSLLSAGLSLTQSLKLTANAIYHPGLKEAFYRIEKELKTGKKFGDILTNEEIIPPFLASILGIASETGSLEETLKTMEIYYLDEFKSIVKNLLNFLQPILLVFVGGIVGFVAITVLVPIYQQISEQLQLQQSQGRIPGQF